MSEHDLILLATKYGSWFGNTLELRRENLALVAAVIEQEAYERGFNAAIAERERLALLVAKGEAS